MAEAKFLRAFAYFKLVRLFGDVPIGNYSSKDLIRTELLFTRVAADQIIHKSFQIYKKRLPT